MSIYLEGLAIQFFRGIGPTKQKLGPFKDFNFFVGANNAGKSTVLDLIHRHLAKNNDAQMPQTVDEYTGAETGNFYYAMGISERKFTEAVLLKSTRLQETETATTTQPDHSSNPSAEYARVLPRTDLFGSAARSVRRLLVGLSHKLTRALGVFCGA
jgi:predicted ATP-dependent endonuclease of OLD family